MRGGQNGQQNGPAPAFYARAGGCAIVVRAGGRLEVVIPKTESGMSPPPHVVLTLFAIAFEDPRLHALLEQIVK